VHSLPFPSFEWWSTGGYNKLDSFDQREGDKYPLSYGIPVRNGMVLHFYQQQESSTTKTEHKVINKGLKACV